MHDWDSVIAQPETAIVGLAAAMWPREEGPDVVTASVAQTADFITSYQLQAGREWDRWEIRDAWAAGLWVRLIYAKQEAPRAVVSNWIASPPRSMNGLIMLHSDRRSSAVAAAEPGGPAPDRRRLARCVVDASGIATLRVLFRHAAAPAPDAQAGPP